ncbi:MAG: bifunctional nicotinamide-nucleotide adenylyltransferase/Nudix hydroxylase [Nevskia sp.]|nr:bifunctional nicotinamide-nucleotide adenylyltransferase/Nudix hydroxylase [Nevskia sp.]
MNDWRYDLLVFIGRFQPFHNGHLAVVRGGLEQAEHLLVLAGSADRPRSIRDPFTAAERAELIRGCLTPREAMRVTVAPLPDAMYNDAAWIGNVHRAVFDCVRTRFADRPEAQLRIGLVGHSKDHSSYYLKLFPTWGAVDVRNHQGISATDLRRVYFRQPYETGKVDAQTETTLATRLPAPALRWLRTFALTDAYQDLKAEQAYVEEYQSQFRDLKYPPQHHTADAVVTQGGHILLVRRGGRPGRGQLALPGGFIQEDETAFDAAVRELREETCLEVADGELRGAVAAKELFDDPHRSTRGRTFTTAFRFDLRPDTRLPPVQAGDDADQAFWLPLAKLRSQEMFEDHYYIVRKMVGV